MELRKADASEFAIIRDFYWELIDQMGDRIDTCAWQKGIYPSDEMLRGSLERGEIYTLPRDGAIAACVILNSSWNEGYEGTSWQVECSQDEVLVPHALGVLPSFHGQGIGRAVVRDIIEMARAAGMKAIRLDILDRNVAARRLYLGEGFRFIREKELYYPDTGVTSFELYELVL